MSRVDAVIRWLFILGAHGWAVAAAIEGDVWLTLMLAWLAGTVAVSELVRWAVRRKPDPVLYIRSFFGDDQ